MKHASVLRKRLMHAISAAAESGMFAGLTSTAETCLDGNSTSDSTARAIPVYTAIRTFQIGNEAKLGMDSLNCFETDNN